MKIGKETRFDWIMDRHWHQMADQLDLKFAYLKKLLRETAEALEKNTREMADDINSKYNGKKTIEKICRTINKHIKHVETYL